MATRIVTGTWLAPDAVTPQTGTVAFAPNRRLTRTTAPRAIVPARPLILELDAEGSITVELPCTGTTDFEPADWVWTITEVIHGAPETRWAFELPDDPDTLDIAAIDPIRCE